MARLPFRLLTACLLLGFASGLPYQLLNDVLKLRLSQAGIDVGTIGLAGLVALPFSLKILWAPLVDAVGLPAGRRRGWLLLCQVGLVAGIAGLGLLPLGAGGAGLPALLACALVVATASATQDLAGDGWRTDAAPEPWRASAASAWVLAWRGAYLVAGGAALFLVAHLGWSGAYLAMAACMGLGIAGSLIAAEPTVPGREGVSWALHLIAPFVGFLRRHRWHALLLVIFVLLYKLPDAVLNSQAATFLDRHGYTTGQIGGVKTGLGLLATLGGVAVGGVLVPLLGQRRGLLWFGLIQAVSNLTYAGLALLPPSLGWLVAAVSIENFCGGLVTPLFVAFLMALCDRRGSATQYALLTALMAVGRDVLAAPAGFLVVEVGWSHFFSISALLAIPGLLLLPVLRDETPAETL